MIFLVQLMGVRGAGNEFASISHDPDCVPMDQLQTNLELLAPAGNFEKLKTAFHYGADAVYAGLAEFSLRAQTGEFTPEDLAEWISYTRSANKKIYVTANVYAHNRDLGPLREHAQFLREIAPDAVIVSDPGVFRIMQKEAPQIPIHISTQANTTNAQSALFWQDLGASRIVLAREVSLPEIQEIREAVDLELEAFVHGAVCIAYSGRCFISSFMANRSGNKGECANSCRWTYSLVEEKRPGEYYPVFENERGTFIMSSKDLRMLEHLDDLIQAGIDSFKLEGRMKGINYAAGVVKVYREALNEFSKGRPTDEQLEEWLNELSYFSSRGFTTGMYYGPQPDEDYNHDTPSYVRSDFDLAGVIHSRDERTGLARVDLRTTVRTGDTITFLTPGLEWKEYTIRDMRNTGDQTTDVGKNGETVFFEVPEGVRPMDLVRKRKAVKNGNQPLPV